MIYLAYTIFGFLPSIIWLRFYLKKDIHPESKKMILKIFFWGMFITIPALLFELGFQYFWGHIAILNIFIGIAFTEEFFKYLVVHIKVLRDPEFDEPVDAMIYMIIAGLGFAALENLLILFKLGPTYSIGDAFSVTLFRFISATFLHALCGATIGYFLALSFFKPANRKKLVAIGLGITTLLHGIYNFSIIEVGGWLSFFIPAIVLICLAIFVSFAFRKVKALKITN